MSKKINISTVPKIKGKVLKLGERVSGEKYTKDAIIKTKPIKLRMLLIAYDLKDLGYIFNIKAGIAPAKISHPLVGSR